MIHVFSTVHKVVTRREQGELDRKLVSMEVWLRSDKVTLNSNHKVTG